MGNTYKRGSSFGACNYIVQHPILRICRNLEMNNFYGQECVLAKLGLLENLQTQPLLWMNN